MLEGLSAEKPEATSKTEIPLAGILEQIQKAEAEAGKPVITETPRFTDPQEARDLVRKESERQRLEGIRRNMEERVETAAKAAQMKAAENYKGSPEEWEAFDKKVGEDAKKAEWQRIAEDPSLAPEVAQIMPTTDPLQNVIAEMAHGEKRQKKKKSEQKVPFFEKVKDFFKKMFAPKPAPVRMPPPMSA